MAGGGEARVMCYCELDAPPRFPRRVWCVRASGRFERSTPTLKEKRWDEVDDAALRALEKVVTPELRGSREDRVEIPYRSERRRRRHKPSP